MRKWRIQIFLVPKLSLKRFQLLLLALHLADLLLQARDYFGLVLLDDLPAANLALGIFFEPTDLI